MQNRSVPAQQKTEELKMERKRMDTQRKQVVWMQTNVSFR